MPLAIICAALLAGLAAAPGVAQARSLHRVTIITDRAVPAEPKVSGRMRITGARPLSTRIGIEVRGHSSQAFPKQQYAVETRKADGSNRDVAPLGLPAGDDLVLSAPYSDKSLFRNALAYRTARRMGRYAPRTRFVELSLNGDYRGVYVLTERLKLGDGRLPEHPQAFLLELTFPFQARGEDRLRGPRSRRPILWHEPDRRDRSKQEERRIRAAIASFEHALYARGRRGASRDYAEQVDVGAAVDYLLVQELFKNKDAFHGSTYVHRSPDGRVALGPAWDFDLSMGNANTHPAGTLTGFISSPRPWAKQLMRDERFRRALRARWRQLRDAGLRADLLRDIAAMRRSLHGGPAARNFARWPTLGRYVCRTRVTRARADSAPPGTAKPRSCAAGSFVASPGSTASSGDESRKSGPRAG